MPGVPEGMETLPGEAPGGETLVDARGVTVRFGEAEALSAVDLAVRRGEIVTLIGPNGCGKTTLVRVIIGLLAPSAGTVYRRPGLRLGYVPQHLHVDETLPLTVRRFLRLAAPDTGAEIPRAAAEVGAERLLDRPFQKLSGGEARRVLLAGALLRKPDLLVLDEPAAGVDVIGRAELYALIDGIRRTHGCGVLLVSHDLHLVMAATDRVVCLNRHVCCTGRPETVSRHPAYRALFAPEEAAHLAVYTHDHDHRHALSGRPRGAAGEPPPREPADG